jgi:uncharacterized protein (TIGR02266 family)
MTDDTTGERREHARTPIVLLVEYEGADDFVGDFTDNLSSGGTFVLTSRVLTPDTRVKLVLSFPGLLQPIALEAIVRWSRGGEEPGVGVQFLDDDGRERLAGLVERVRNRDPGLMSRVVKVLVVEDNPHVAELIRAGLKATATRNFNDELAFAFATATNGADAVTLLEQDQFDVLIIDVYLPIMDGAQVISRVRRDLGLTSLPIIAVSAGGMSARDSALVAGANFFLDKPMRLRQVIDTMRQLSVIGPS